MNTKRYLAASVAAGVFIFIYGWLVHGILLADYWAEHMAEGSMRPEEEMIMWAIAVSCLLQGLALGFIFTRGYQDKGIMEGVRFGLLIAWFMIALYFLHYALSPVEAIPMVTGAIIDAVMYVVVGVILAALYKPEPAPGLSY